MTAHTPHGRVVDDLVADGAWHDLDELVAAAGPHIPPGVAWRAADREYSTRNPQRGAAPRRSTDESLIATGARRMVAAIAWMRVRYGRWETAVIDGRRHWRLTP